MNNAEKRLLLERYYLDFFSLAMSILQDEQDACDAVQEAIVNVLTSRHVKQVRAYTMQVVRRCAVDIIRHRKRFLLMHGKTASFEKWNGYEEMLTELGRMRDELPEPMRTIVELHDEDGYNYAELSEVMSMSPSSIRRHLNEAHRILKKRIEEEI